MKVALCQINTIMGNFDYNYDNILKFYNKSIELKSDIVGLEAIHNDRGLGGFYCIEAKKL